MSALARPRLYGRRKGKRLRPAQAALLRDLLPRLRIQVPASGEILDPKHLFAPRPRAVWLEIGFGGGEHLASLAAAYPEIGFVGCEPFVNGVVKLLSAVAEGGLSNVRIHADDARPLLASLRPGSIGRAFILFPDPWPKVRHHKRRIVETGSLDHLARGMAPGAELRLATDDPEYALWMLEELGRHPDFEGPAASTPLASLAERPPDWPPTRYERKALAAGRKPAYLLYRRRF
jgi:tRNA (guanine-N7-)-methyltransferase